MCSLAIETPDTQESFFFFLTSGEFLKCHSVETWVKTYHIVLKLLHFPQVTLKSYQEVSPKYCHTV